MSRKRGFFHGVREHVGRAVKGEVLIHKLHGSCMTRERLPPRLNKRGISLAARAVSHEIRNYVKKRTGKDLAQVQDSKLRKEAIEKISDMKVALEGSGSAKTNFLILASCHNTHLAKTLSPEGVDLIDCDYGFRKYNSLYIVSKYHQQCKKDGQISNPSTLHSNLPLISAINEHKFPSQKLCTCHGAVLDDVKKESPYFLGCWQHKGILEDDLFKFLHENLPYFQKHGMLHQIIDEKDWTEFIRNDKCTVFRKQLPMGIYQYRVQASFTDISAKNLFRTQLDGDYRKKWDPYIVGLNIVDSNPEACSELVHWVTKCPYPFATREYIYLRRHKIDKENKAMILLQKATDKTNIPLDPKVVRIEIYDSSIIIKPHSEDFDERGCDFLLSYYEDPKIRLPSRVMDLASSRGIVDSVKQMHKAALGLES